MKHIISLIIISLCALFSLFTHASKVVYVGTYTHENKPALMVQFDEKSNNKDVATIIDVKTNESLSAYWVFNENKTALINTKVIAGNSYKVSLSGEFSDNVEKESIIAIPEVVPSLTVLSKGPVIPANSARTIPISTTNLNTVSVEVLQVTSPENLINQLYYNNSIRAYNLANYKKYYKSVTTLSFELPKTAINAAVNTAIQLPQELKNGWYILSVKGGGMMGYNDAKIIQAFITDVGIQAKVFADNLSINALYLSSNNPIIDGKVSIYRKDGTKQYLGKLQDGFANFKYKASTDELLVIETGDQLGILPLREVPLDLSDFSVTGRNWQEMEAFAYSNRDLFKPGETLPLNVLLRDDDGHPVSTQRLFVEFIQPDGKVISMRWLEPQVSGYYRTNYLISRDATLGKWTAQIKANKDSQTILNSFSFNVSEFVPERMDLLVDIENKELISTKQFTAKVVGRYLFGAPADGNKLKIKPYYLGVNHIKGKYENYFVGKAMNVFPSRQLPLIKAHKLDAKGEATITIPLIDEKYLKSPVIASFNFELLETGGASVSRKHEISLWKNKVIAGILPKFDSARYFQNVEFDLALLAPAGDKLMAGTINYTLARNRGGYYWSHSVNNGWVLHRDNEWRPVSINTLNMKKGSSTAISLPVEYGQYRLVAKTSEGLETQYDFYVGWRAGNATDKPIKPDALSLTFDKDKYHNGETIKAKLQADLSGYLLVTLETDQVHWQQSIDYHGQALELNIPLANALTRHDIYVTATLIGEQQNMPRRMFAVKPVRLERKEREISVVIENKDKIRPLTKSIFSIKANVGNKEKAFVTLSVVDRGILNLSGYQAPSITEHFFDQRRYAGDVIDLYSRVYQQRPNSFLTHRYGGDAAAMANDKPDNLVESKTIVLMSELLALDEFGNADVVLELPDYNGEAEVVATVFSDSSFGQTQKNVKISSPIVAELAVPRFLTPNDRSQVLLELFNTSGSTQTVSAVVESTNALTFEGKNSLTSTLKDGERISIAVPFTVNSFADEAEVTINTTSPIFNQERSWSIPVRVPKPILTKKTSITLSPDEKFMVNQQYWDELQPMSSDMGNISFSPVPFLDTIEYASGLFRYPYGCAEQTTSKALPWLIDDPSLNNIKLAALKGRTADQMLEMAVMRLTKMQKSNGGFSLWDKYGREDGWLSVYVTDFLFQTAQKHPNIVPINMLNLALTRIGTYTTQWGSATQHYATWVLAKANKLEYSKFVLVEKNTLKTPLSAAHLGGAAMLLGDMNKAQLYFSQVTGFTRKLTYYSYRDYGSTIRDYAQAVAIIGELQQQVKLSPAMTKLRNTLVAQLKKIIPSKHYFSTQEKVALVRAGSDLAKENTKEFNFIIEGIKQSYSGLNSRQIDAGSIIENSNEHEMFIEIRAKGYSLDNVYQKPTISMQNFSKKIKYEDGKHYDGKAIAVGEKLIVALSFEANEKVNNAMLIDFIPSGFVLENPDFTNSADIIAANKLKNSVTDFIEYRNDRFVTSLNVSNRKTYSFNYVIRAETPGDGLLPKGYIEDMYAPERFTFVKSEIDKVKIVNIKANKSLVDKLVDSLKFD